MIGQRCCLTCLLPIRLLGLLAHDSKLSGLALTASIHPLVHSGTAIAILRHAYRVLNCDDLVFLRVRALSFVIVSRWAGSLSAERHFLSHNMKIPTASLAAAQTSLEEVDRTTAIKISSWTLLSVTVVVFIARQVMKTIVFRRLALDDALALVAAVSDFLE